MELYLVRHGQSEGNISRTNEGWNRGRLTELGRRQAQAVGVRLAAVEADAIIHSDLVRAQETAQQIAKHHPDTPLLASEMLREWNIGIYAGTPYGTIFQKIEASGIAKLDFPIEGGETISEFKGRVERAIDEIKTQYAHDTVIIVTHGGFILNAMLYLLDLPDERFAEFDPENTGVAYLTVDDGHVTLHYQNDTSHLERVGRSGETTFLKKD